MANTIIIFHDIMITVHDVAVGTKKRMNASTLGRATLLLLLIFLATTSATDPDGHTPRVDIGHVNDTRGHNGGIENPGNETDYDDALSKLDDNKNMTIQKLETLKQNNSTKFKDHFIRKVAAQRRRASVSILRFMFNFKRIRLLTNTLQPPNGTKGIIYWMYRDQRVHDNWSVLYAQKYAIQLQVPLHVVFCTPNAASTISLRQYEFMIQGLKEVQREFQSLNIQFHFGYGSAVDVLSDFVTNHNIGAIVLDFLPLRDYMNQTRQLTHIYNHRVPVIMVDAHNVVPSWTTSSNLISDRHKSLFGKCGLFLTEFPPVIQHPLNSELKPQPIKWEDTDSNFKIDLRVLPNFEFKGGYKEGMREFERFMNNKLKNYGRNMMDPMKNGLSNLSPWLHFGHISAQRVLLEVFKFSRRNSLDASRFKTDVLVQRELADNFCNNHLQNYDSVEGANHWAKVNLHQHRNDPREYLYTRDQFEKALTHDRLWNAAQTQMVVEGKMHRFLRTYWAKKLLEWSDTPESALATANYLNNRYSLDGNDPSGYVGCMWAICGVHDRPLNITRPIFGSIRYLALASCQSRFDTEAYIKKYQEYDFN